VLAVGAVLGRSFSLDDVAVLLRETPARLLPEVEAALGADLLAATSDTLTRAGRPRREHGDPGGGPGAGRRAARRGGGGRGTRSRAGRRAGQPPAQPVRPGHPGRVRVAGRRPRHRRPARAQRPGSAVPGRPGCGYGQIRSLVVAAQVAEVRQDTDSTADLASSLHAHLTHRPSVLLDDLTAPGWLVRFALGEGNRKHAEVACAAAGELAAGNPGFAGIAAAAAHARGLLDHDDDALRHAAESGPDPWARASAARTPSRSTSVRFPQGGHRLPRRSGPGLHGAGPDGEDANGKRPAGKRADLVSQR
jgi:hypothetical protein